MLVFYWFLQTCSFLVFLRICGTQEELEARPSGEEVLRLRGRVEMLRTLLDAQMEAEGWEGRGPGEDDEPAASHSTLHSMLQVSGRVKSLLLFFLFPLVKQSMCFNSKQCTNPWLSFLG